MSGRDQSGFSIIELIVALLVVGVIATLAIPTLTGSRDAAAEDDAQMRVDSGWEDAQAFYRGERGVGQLDAETSRYDGFDDPAAAGQVNGRLTWISPAGSPPVSAAALIPGAHSSSVMVARAVGQTIALCASSPERVFCRADDGLQPTGFLGSRFGVSAVSAQDALTHTCHASWEQASDAQRSGNATSCALG